MLYYDMVSGGIMQLALAIFNDNNFPVIIDDTATELARSALRSI
jgi:hypothetical protein